MAFVLLAVLALTFAAFAVKATIDIKLTVVETFGTTETPFAPAGTNSVTHSSLNKTIVHDANSVLHATKVGYASLALVAGAASLNLAACPGVNGVVQDFTGLKIRAIILRAKSDNANPITIAKGAANGFTGFGAAFSLTLIAGKQAVIEGDSTAVAAAVRLLDVTGTGTQVLEYMVVIGDN